MRSKSRKNMKKVTSVVLFLLVSMFSQGQKIEWMTMNEALEAQKESPKKIFMDAYTDWCGPCKMLDRNTFSNADVAEYINTHYYPVKFNAEGTEKVTYRGKDFGNPQHDPNRRGRNSQHEFARAIGITAYPSLVFFDEKGDLIGPIPGYRTPHQIEVFLKLFQNEDYKRITTPEAFKKYSDEFKNTFEVAN